MGLGLAAYIAYEVVIFGGQKTWEYPCLVILVIIEFVLYMLLLY